MPVIEDGIKIIINAKDESSKIFDNVKIKVDELSRSTEFARIKFLALAVAINNIGGTGARGLREILGLVKEVNYQLNNTTPGKLLLNRIKEIVDDSLAQTAKLSSILTATTSVVNDFGKGFLPPQESIFTQYESRFERLGKTITSTIKASFIRLFPELKDKFDQLDKDVGKIIGNIAVSQKLPKFVANLAGKDNNLAKQLGIKKEQIPIELQPIFEQISGTEKISQLLSNFNTKGLLNKLRTDGVSKVIGDEIAKALTIGFQDGFIKINNSATKLFGDVGANAGKTFVTKLESKFQIADRVLGGTLTQIYDRIGVKFAQKIANIPLPISLIPQYTFAPQGLKEFIGSKVVKASLVAITKEPVAQLQKLQETFTTKIKPWISFVERFFPQQVGKVRTVAQAFGKTIQTEFVNAVTDPKNYTLDGLSSVKQAIPPTILSLFNQVTKSFTTGVAQVKNAIAGAFSKIPISSELKADLINLGNKLKGAFNKNVVGEIQSIVKDNFGIVDRNTSVKDLLFKTPAERIQKSIEQYQKQLKNLPLKDVAALQRQAFDTVLAPPPKLQVRQVDFNGDLSGNAVRSISKEVKQKQLDQINVQIKLAAISNEERAKLEQRIALYKKAFLDITGANTKVKSLQNQVLRVSLDTQLDNTTKDAVLAGLNKEIQQELNRAFQTPVQRLGRSLRKTFEEVLGVNVVKGFVDNFSYLGTEIRKTFGSTTKDTFTEVGSNAARSFIVNFGREFAKGFAPILNQVDTLILNTFAKIKQLPGRFTQVFDGASKPIFALAGLNEPFQLFDLIKTQSVGAFTAISRVGEQLTFLQSGLATLRTLVLGGPFELLIGQNIRLEEQLLSTKANIVATNRVISTATGAPITDNAKAIAALNIPVKNAIKDLRKDSVDLVGVTSSDLTSVFQIVAGQAGGIGASLSDAKDLTGDFAAALGTAGIPLFQAGQEIRSIFSGNITSDSALASQLGIDNRIVNQWKNQGKLIENIREKLSSFRDANKLGAGAIGGVSSNIKDVYQLIGQQAGEAFLEPIEKELGRFYKFLSTQQQAIGRQLKLIAGEIFGGIQEVAGAFEILFGSTAPILAQLPKYFAGSISNVLGAFASALKSTLTVLKPFIDVLAGLASFIRPIGEALLKPALQFLLLSKGIQLLSKTFGIFANILPFVGELLFGVTLRLLPIVNLIPNLAGKVGLGTAGFLAFGKSLNIIPGAAKAVTGALTQFLGPLGFLAPILTGLIPTVAGAGIGLVGLAKVFPPLNNLLGKFLAANPSGLLSKLGTIIAGLPIASKIPIINSFGNAIGGLSAPLARATQASTVQGLANETFSKALILVGRQVRIFAINTALLGTALYFGVKAVVAFAKEHEELVETIFGVITSIGQLFKDLGTLAGEISNAIPGWGKLAIAIGVTSTAMLFFGGTIKAVVVSQLLSWVVTATRAFNGLNAALATLAFTDTLVQFGSSDRLLSFAGMAAGAANVGKGLTNLGSFLQVFKLSLFTTTAGTLTFGSALGGLQVVIASLYASLAPIIAGLVALLAPIALIAAGIGAIGAIYYARKLEKANNQIAQSESDTNQVYTASYNTISRLNKLRGEQAKKVELGIALSKEELEANQKAKAEADKNTNDLKAQIAERNKLINDKNATKQQKAIAEQQLGDLQKALDAIEKANNDIILQNKALTNKGTIDSQLTERYNNLKTAIAKSNGQEDKFKSNIEETISLVDTLIERGVISADQAQTTLSNIANNVFVDKENQIKASQSLVKAYQEEEAVLARLQKKSLDVLQISQNERLIELKEKYQFSSETAKLAEAEVKLAAKLNKQKLTDARQTLRQLQDERSDLGSNKAISPKQLEEVEGKIRESQLNIQQLILTQLDDEVKAFEAALATKKEALDKFNAQLSNGIQQQNQDLEYQLNLLQSYERSLGIQSKLLSARQDIASSTTGILEKQLKFLAESDRNQRRAKVFNDAIASTKLKALYTAQQIERDNLVIQQEQNRLALEREKIQNRIAQANAIVNIAQTNAELATARANPKTSPEQLQALELKLEAGKESSKILFDVATNLEKQSKLLTQQEKSQLKILQNTQKGAEIDAKLGVIETFTGKDKKSAENSLSKEILSSNGFKNRAEAVAAFRQVSRETKTENLGIAPPPKLDLNDPGLDGLKKLFQEQGKPFEVVTQTIGQQAKPNINYQLPAPILGKDLPKINLDQTYQQVQQNFNAYSQKFDQLIDTINKAQGGSTYNITVNNPKEVKQVSGTTNSSTQDPSITKVLEAAKNLVLSN